MTDLELIREAVIRGSGEWTTHRAEQLFRTIGTPVSARTARTMLKWLASEGVLVRMGDGARRYYVKKEER